MYLLKNALKTTAICAVVAGVAFSAPKAHADASLGASLTATVQNAFNLVETTALDFGSFALFADGATSATIVMPFDGTAATYDNVNDGTSRMIRITGTTRGVYDISAAAPSTALNIVYTPLTGVGATMTCVACTGGNPTLNFATYTDNTVAGVVTTSAAGAFTLQLGGTLSSAAAAVAYEDGVYTGTLTIDANY